MTDITTPIEHNQDQEQLCLRPERLTQFIGQAKAKDNLRIFIDAAITKRRAIDHILLYGPPGLGKTTLAHIVSREMHVGFKASAGPILSKAGDLAAILTNLQPNDVLFIDEIHRLTTAVEEILYSAMEDFTLDIIIGEGPAARTIRIDLPPFTLVGATTRLGLLSNPLRDRFGIPLQLQFYSHADLKEVLVRAATLLSLSINEDAALEVAARARGTPRIALRLLKRIADFAIVEGLETITLDLSKYALTQLEVDAIGLDHADISYLSYIMEHYQGGPVGIETIAAGLSEQRDSIEETIEPYLMQLGYIQRTPRGRIVTPNAYKHLGKALPTVTSKNHVTDEEVIG